MHRTVQPDGVAAWEAPASSPGAGKSAGFSPDRGLPYLMLLLFFVAMYGVVGETVPAVAPLRPALTLALGAVALMVMSRAMSGRPFVLPWPEGHAFVGFLAAAAVSSFTALWPRFAVSATIELAKLVIVYILVVNLVVTRARLRGLIWTIVLAGLMPAVGTINNYLAGNTYEGRAAWLGKFAGPNELAFELAVLVPLAVALMVPSRWWLRLFLLVTVLLQLVAIYVTFSRSGLIALGAVGAVAVLRMKSPGKKFLLGACLLLALAVGAQFWERKESFDELEGDSSFNYRFVTMQVGMGMFEDDPLFGVGLGCSFLDWEQFAPDTFVSDGSSFIVHNTFVQTLAETGLVGFTLFLVLLGSSVLKARGVARSQRANDPELYAYAVAIELSIIAFVVASLANGFLLLAAPYVFVALASSLRGIALGDPAPEAA